MKKASTSSETPGQIQISLELLVATIEAAKDSIMITTTELNEPGPTIVYVNPAFTRMTGYSLAETIGRNPRFLQGLETDRKVMDELRHKLSRKEVFCGKAVNYRKDGSTFVNEWHIKPIVTENSQISHFLAIQHDVTEREKAYQMLAESEKQRRQQAIMLEEQAAALENKNNALHEMLQQIQWEKQKVKQDNALNHTLNISEIILPILRKLKRKSSQVDQAYLTVLENSLRDLNSRFGRNLIERDFGLSPREVEIANMARQGLATKAIALTLNIAIGTVEIHRRNIRKKLGITNVEVNLTNYLQKL
ncbi:MAG: PAS domain S-box protein [Maribacter sp.]|nr:PAS domain S-box protein [Maribacter sp.]